MIQSYWPEDLRYFVAQMKKSLGGFFIPNRELWVARAPARLDVIAGLSNYAGATVLQTPLQEGVIVAVQKRLDRRFLIRNLNFNRDRILHFEYRLDDLFDGPEIKTYAVLQQQFAHDPKTAWLAHVLGMVPVLIHEGHLKQWQYGANIAISSTIPIGAAVASSTALEVAHFLAAKSAFGIEMDGFQSALACQAIENRVVGTPCGLTDHVAITLGQKGRTMVLRCQPHELLKMLEMPAGMQWVGIYSGVSHPNREARYRDMRIASFMGRKIIAQHAPPLLEESPFGGYLCNIEPEEWETRYRKSVLAKISGQEFINRYADHEDPATVIDAEKRYFPRPATEHHIMESRRVFRLLDLLERGRNQTAFIEAGELLYASHGSYTENGGLGTKETDTLVDLIKAHGPEKGLYGAKVTGWGSGGAVAVLAATGTEDVLRNIVRQYQDKTGKEAFLFFGSSSGAVEMGVIRLVME